METHWNFKLSFRIFLQNEIYSCIYGVNYNFVSRVDVPCLLSSIEPVLSNESALIKLRIRTEMSVLILKNKYFNPASYTPYTEIMRFIASDNFTVVTKADIGHRIVTLDRHDYVMKYLAPLNDSPTYWCC